MIEQISSGNFTYRTMKMQYSSVQNIGPLNNFMSLIPGIGNQLAGQMNDKEGQKKIKRYLVILDSFN